jgi:hypothetical protein
MSTNNLTKETEIRLMNFFNNQIDPDSMAKALRQVNFSLALGVMNEDKTIQNEVIKLKDNFYWLNELAEILNPYLDAE